MVIRIVYKQIRDAIIVKNVTKEMLLKEMYLKYSCYRFCFLDGFFFRRRIIEEWI